MKTISILIALFFSYTIKAQSIYGVMYDVSPSVSVMTSYLFKTDTSFANLQTVYTFSNSIGNYNFGDNILEIAGNKIYGTGYSYGGYTTNSIFSLDTATNAFTIVRTFNDTILGTRLNTINAINNKLYGVSTYFNMKGKKGSVLFEYNPTTSLTRILCRNLQDSLLSGFLDFNLSYRKVNLHSNGKFYFECNKQYSGGFTEDLFECDTVSKTMYSVIDFDPLSLGLGTETIGYNNNIYGSMGIGKDATHGATLFEYNPLTSNYNPLVTLTPYSGTFTTTTKCYFNSNPLIFNNNIYTITNGGTYDKGTISKYNLATNNFTTCYTFNLPNSGYVGSQVSNIIPITSNSFLGFLDGGNFSQGAAFKFNTTNNAYTKLYNVPSNRTISTLSLLYTGIIPNITTGFNITTDLNSKLLVYPNPTSGQLNISGLDINQKQITITNVVGDNVRIIETNGNKAVSVDVENLSPGVYFIVSNNKALKFIKE